MKKVVLTFLMLQFVFFAFSQTEKPAELFYDLHKINTRSISQSALKVATSISDIDEKYPSSWVKEYISVEVVATCSGVVKRAKGKSEKLNTEQREILKMADYGTEVVVDVNYIPNNTLKHNDVQNINFAMPVLPEIEAEFPGGSGQMMQYLKENIENRIPESTSIKDVNWTALRFIIDTDGSIINVRAEDSTGFEVIDKLIMEAICEMPKWIPAVDSNKAKVQQEYVFVLGNTSKICALNVYYMNGRFL